MSLIKEVVWREFPPINQLEAKFLPAFGRF